MLRPWNIGTFTNACDEFRQAMQADVELNDEEQLELENNFTIIYLAYMQWKRRNVQPQPLDPA